MKKRRQGCVEVDFSCECGRPVQIYDIEERDGKVVIICAKCHRLLLTY